MKKMTLIAIAGLAIAITPALAQTDTAPSGPAIIAAEDHSAHAAPDLQVAPKGEALGALGAGQATIDVNWDNLDDTTRFLSIMGTADGFSAAGAGSPCFPGKDNAKLDVELKAAGFGAKNGTELAGALTLLSAPAEQCKSAPQRGYSSDLLKTMPDEHLATYLSGVVRGYSQIKTCAVENHPYAAATIAAELFATTTPKAPHELISAALAGGCDPAKA